MLQHRSRGPEVVGPAQQGLNFGHQHALVKGLGDEVVSTQVHGHDDVHIVRRRRDKDHRHPGYPADLRAPVVAVEAGQADVQQHQMGVKGGELLHHMPRVLHLAHL